MKYIQILCFFFALTEIKCRQFIYDDYSSSNTVKNETRSSDRVKSLNGNVTKDVYNYDIRNVNAESVGNLGQNTPVENNRNTASSHSEVINHVLTSSNRGENLDRYVTQQNYNLEEMQQEESFENVIFLIDSNSKEVEKKVIINRHDLNTTLNEVREKLKTQGLRVEDRFGMEVNGSFFPIPNEAHFTLNDIKNGNAVFVDFNSGNLKQYLKGLKKDADGQFVMTNHTVAYFKRYPRIRTLDYSGFQSGYAYDPKEMDILKFGITDKSANYAKILSYSATQNNTYRSGKSTNYLPLISYSIARYIVEKKDIEITKDDLTISSQFYDEIQRALSSSGLSLPKAKKLLAVIQKYGWYVPLHYKTGGFFYVTDNQTIYNAEEAVGNSHNLLRCFHVAATRISIDNIEKRAPNCPQMSNIQHVDNIDINEMISSPPARFINYSSLVGMYKQNLRDRKQWKIVEYKRLLPILMLLEDDNNWILSQCMRLLSEFRMDLQEEEAGINLREYLLSMEKLLYKRQ